MKYLAAYCLLALGGKQSPTEDDLKKFFKALDQEVNEESLKLVVSSLSGKQLHELCKQGQAQIGSLSLGGSSSGPAPAQAKGETKQAKQEEKPKTEEEEENVDMGGFFD